MGRLKFDFHTGPGLVQPGDVGADTVVVNVGTTYDAAYLADEVALNFAGKAVTVLGRSQHLGAPLARTLADRDATVTVCHSSTLEDLRHRTLAEADYVFAAAGCWSCVEINQWQCRVGTMSRGAPEI